MLSFKRKVSPLCNILLKRQSAYKQVVYSNTLYTHRLPLKDKPLPTVATCCHVEHYLNSVATELVSLCSISIHQHNNLCHLVGDFHSVTAVRREGDTSKRRSALWQGQGWFGGWIFFVYLFEKYIFYRKEMPTSEVLQKLLKLAFSVPSFLCTQLLKIPGFVAVPLLDSWIRLWQPKDFCPSRHYLFVRARYTCVCYLLFIQWTQLLEASYFHQMPCLPAFQICFKGIRQLTNPFWTCCRRYLLGN